MKIKILKTKSINIEPNFIYNRCDLYCDDYITYSVFLLNKHYNIQCYMENDVAYLGLWLMDVENDVLKEIIKDILKNKRIKRVYFQNYLKPYGSYNKLNHFKIELPNTEKELNDRITKKNRYNIERSKRLLEEKGDVEFCVYSEKKDLIESVKKYFVFKKSTHSKEYNMTEYEYIRKYHVTNSYELRFNNNTISVILSCEQCPIVYIENISYDVDYSKYSPGKILYDYYLKKLVEKKVRTIYLAGGKLEYKKHYGSIEQTTYDCVVFKNKLSQLIYVLKQCVKKVLGK